MRTSNLAGGVGGGGGGGGGISARNHSKKTVVPSLALNLNKILNNKGNC